MTATTSPIQIPDLGSLSNSINQISFVIRDDFSNVLSWFIKTCNAGYVVSWEYGDYDHTLHVSHKSKDLANTDLNMEVFSVNATKVICMNLLYRTNFSGRLSLKVYRVTDDEFTQLEQWIRELVPTANITATKAFHNSIDIEVQ